MSVQYAISIVHFPKVFLLQGKGEDEDGENEVAQMGLPQVDPCNSAEKKKRKEKEKEKRKKNKRKLRHR
jgi:hypothetical protein